MTHTMEAPINHGSRQRIFPCANTPVRASKGAGEGAIETPTASLPPSSSFCPKISFCSPLGRGVAGVSNPGLQND